MICFKDRTFCSFYVNCKKGHECDRALTPEVLEDATEWWGKPSPPMCVFVGYPGCFDKKLDKEEEK